MPLEFLTDDHLTKYGRYQGEPSPEQLARHFYLDAAELALIFERRQDHTRLGFAVQLCTLKFLGTFLTDPTDVPALVIRTLANQLDIRHSGILPRYLDRRSTKFEHQALIRDFLRYRDFDDVQALGLLRFLYARLRLGDERPIQLFDLCVDRLVQRHVILPGASRLVRLVTGVRERVAGQLHRQLAGRLNDTQKAALEELVSVPDGQRLTPLERLRTPPTRLTSNGLLDALRRIETIRDVGVSDLDLSDVPASRLMGLARQALVAWGQTIARLSEQRRHATLLAVTQHLERSATDDALDVFDALMNGLGLKGEQKRRQERLRSLRDLDGAALVLRDAVRLLLNSDIPDAEVREVIFARIGQGALVEALGTVSEVASEVDHEEVEAWNHASGVIIRFLNTLLDTITFEGTPAAKSLLDAITFLHSASGRGRVDWREAPRSFIPHAWEPLVFSLDEVEPERRAYQVCVAHQLHQLLRRREVFVIRSHQHGDPRAQLLSGEVWEGKRLEVCRMLNWSSQAQVALDGLAQELHEAYLQTVAALPENTAVSFRVVDGVSVPVLQEDEAPPVPESLTLLNAQLDARLPDIDLSELLLEIASWTGFVVEMGSIGEGTSRRSDLAVSVCAVLVAQACNIGLKAVARPHVPALTIGRLSWVQQHHIRADTLTRANARLVDAQASLDLARRWGGGEVASADGLRFTVPVRNIVAAPNSRYFGRGRGVTYLNWVSDQFTGFHGLVVPGTLRDSLNILAGLLEQQTSLKPTELMSDSAGYSDVVFGLFRLLGFQFSPRLADLESMRYWRLDRTADYGPLQEVSRHRLDGALIARHWDDLLRLAGSLKLGTVKAQDAVRVLSRDGSLSGLGKAVAELGRIAKTCFMLAYLNDEGYRRRIQVQLNRGESRHALARQVCHGHKGELRQRYREGLEDQLGALGLVVNAIALWNTRYLGSALDWLRGIGEDVRDEDVARLSPLKFAHINMLGRYHFEVPDDVAAGAMRPLRDPDSLDPFELAWS